MKSLLHGAAGLYQVGLKARSLAYEMRLRSVRTVPEVSVVSVGGLRTGGEGKTPFAIHIAAHLLHRGQRVAFVSRGYRGRWEHRGGVVSNGRDQHEFNPRLAGDEAVLAARRLPKAIVVVGANRSRAVATARDLGAQVVVLDSGFQRWDVARHLDIVTQSQPWNYAGEELIPLGCLREPPKALRRADLVASMLEGDQPDEDDTRPEVTFRLVPLFLTNHRLEPNGILDQLRGARVLAVVGIARGHRLSATLRQCGSQVVETLQFRDHHFYTERDRRQIVRKATRLKVDAIITTEKDILRLGAIESHPLRSLRVGVVIEDGKERLRKALEELQQSAIMID